ncbi:MAG: alpha-L-fucosidase [Lachnospiraceae bacterium]|nr:alpha-L-fucosidase [Lachnospiraceae bacterium]
MFLYDKQKELEKIDSCIRAGRYKDTWESLAEHETPRWFRDAKFGIFIHWGIYSVPAFGSEWYSRNMYIQGSPEFEHHVKTYGAQKDFGYKDFIPMFKAEKFDAAEWISLFRQAGAKYIVPVAEHHDGFQMYDSALSKWNAANMGPCRNVLGELSEEAKKAGLVNGASTHRIEHWFFMGHGKEFESDITDAEQPGDFYWPAMPEQNHHDLFSEPVPTQEFLEDWMIRTCELIDRYRVKELYFDWWIQHSSAKPYLKKVAAYYYNRALEWGEEVMIAYKHDAFMFGTAVVDIERGQFANIQPFAWQTDTAIAKNSWCYTEHNDFKKARDILCDLADIVSKNGCLLLNVGPKADGTISEEDTAVLKEIGDWLAANGEAIYGTRTWRIAAEGPTAVEEGQFTDGRDKVFTSEDFRFTRKGENLYAICLNYPADGKVLIRALGEQDASRLPKFHGIIDRVSVLGFDEEPRWERTQEGLTITTETVASDKPVVFRVTLR